MPFTSSPVAYPLTSSPHADSPRKRRKLDPRPPKKPLQDVVLNARSRVIGGFVLDDSDGDEDAVEGAPCAKPVPKEKDKSLNETCERTPFGAPQCPSREERFGIALPTPIAPSQMLSFAAQDSTRTFSPTKRVSVSTCSGKTLNIHRRLKQNQRSYEEIAAERSSTAGPGRAQKSYYGIDIHQLIEDAAREDTARQARIDEEPDPVETSVESDRLTKPQKGRQTRTLMWTEKYRARKFTDLVGDERTHRSVLRWLKAWDPIVFPGAARPKPKQKLGQDGAPERQHRKILLLTGPPGLGKTTLAHVCAKQAGYEVQEINASDERSRDVVKGRIRDMVGTENVRQVNAGTNSKGRKAARPVCVVVDEVDGVVSGNGGGGGEGGFIKALSDLIVLDERNCKGPPVAADGKKKRKGDSFRLLRPLILICNDVYHPALRLLRSGTMAEIVYVRKPRLNMIVPRIQAIFEKEGVPCDSDGVRSLCEASWGVGSRKEDKAAGGASEGDIRGLLVVGEWVAAKFRAIAPEVAPLRLTKKWIEQHMLGDLGDGGGASRSIGRGGTREVVDRVFTHNAGFPPTAPTPEKVRCFDASSAIDTMRQRTMDRLREIIEITGEDDRIISDCFATYPSLPFQDDTFLSKPCSGYEWLNFHDQVSGRVHACQEWELAPYLSSPVLAFHHLFASNSRHSYNAAAKPHTDSEDAVETPFSGMRASYEAFEAEKANKAALLHLHSQLCLPLHRQFRSAEGVATELLPYLLRMLSPDVKPVVVGGSDNGVASVRRGPEKEMVLRGVQAMIACGVTFEKNRVDLGESTSGATGGFVYRMEPGLDALGLFETKEKGGDGAKTRFAVRQVLEQEWKREVVRREQEGRARRMRGDGAALNEGEAAAVEATMLGKQRGQAEENANNGIKPVKAVIKRDFFGRPIIRMDADGNGVVEDEGTKKAPENASQGKQGDGRIYVSYHEGYSNAVSKGITMKELLQGL